MPYLDGFGLAQRIRILPSNAGVPIVMTTPASPVFSSRQFAGFKPELSTLLEPELLTLLRHSIRVLDTIGRLVYGLRKETIRFWRLQSR
jgi:hypothetical protein